MAQLISFGSFENLEDLLEGGSSSSRRRGRGGGGEEEGGESSKGVITNKQNSVISSPSPSLSLYSELYARKTKNLVKKKITMSFRS